MNLQNGLMQELGVHRLHLFSQLTLYLERVRRGEPRAQVLTDAYHLLSPDERLFLIGVAFEALATEMDSIKTEEKDTHD